MKTIYCEHCGTKLVATKTLDKFYDADTGKRGSHYKYRCPNKKWYEFWHEVQGWVGD